MLPTSLVVAIALIYEFSLSEFNVLESVVIEKYFHLGFAYETITDLLQSTIVSPWVFAPLEDIDEDFRDIILWKGKSMLMKT